MLITLAEDKRKVYKLTGQSALSRYLELFIVGTLCISIAVIFFNVPRWTRAFGEAGFGALIIWALYHKRKPVYTLPRFLIVFAVLYILSYVINVFRCADPNWEHVDIRKYIYIIIGGLLFSFPLKNKYKKFMIVVLIGSASVAGAKGVYQYLKGGMGTRAVGFSDNALHFAGLIGIVCCTTVLLLFMQNRKIFESKQGTIFLYISSIVTFLGVISSKARGVWVAFIVSVTITLFLLNRRKLLLYALSFLIILSTVFFFFSDIRSRAAIIMTSIITKEHEGSTRMRIELYKGSFYLFKESPLLGVGTGNFEQNIDRLIRERKIEEIPVKMHAHNIFIQALATRGLIGLVITLGFFITMIIWGADRILYQKDVGGYVIISSTIFTIIGGLTENNIEFTRFMAAYCFTLGLFGQLSAINNSEKVIAQDDSKSHNAVLLK